MSGTGDANFDHRLHKLVRQAEIAKMTDRDRWNLPPIEKGWLRGAAQNVRQSEETCEFGMLQVLEFDLVTDPKQPPVPVRMTGTYFTTRLLDTHVMDVPDPTPTVRPVTPVQIFFSHSNRETELRSYYPGRDAQTKRAGAMLGLAAVGGPILALVVSLAVLRFAFHVF